MSRRENAGTSVAGNNVATADGDDDYVPQQKGKAGFSAFAALGIEEAAPEEEDEDFGGLMVTYHTFMLDKFGH